MDSRDIKACNKHITHFMSLEWPLDVISQDDRCTSQIPEFYAIFGRYKTVKITIGRIPINHIDPSDMIKIIDQMQIVFKECETLMTKCKSIQESKQKQ